jgi:hypothetical protein
MCTFVHPCPRAYLYIRNEGQTGSPRTTPEVECLTHYLGGFSFQGHRLLCDRRPDEQGTDSYVIAAQMSRS